MKRIIRGFSLAILATVSGWLVGYALFAPAQPPPPKPTPYADKLTDAVDAAMPGGPGLQTPCASAPYPALVNQPVGVVGLFSPGNAVCTETNWQNPNMDGYRLRVAWTNFETSEGVYDWAVGQHPGFSPCKDAINSNGLGQGNDLDAAISMAAATGKWLGISISGGTFCPGWIYASPSPGIFKFNLDYSDQTNNGDPFMPLLWDTRYQTKFHNFLNAFTAHIQALESTIGRPVVRYVVVTGHVKAIDMRTFCQNTDASVLLNDATVTSVGGKGRIDSPSGNFLRANPSCTVSPVPTGCLVGQTVTDDLLNPVHIAPNTTVCDHNTSGCSDPAATTIWLSKAPLGCPAGCALPNFYVFTWLINQGEFSQLDAIAKSPPAGYGLGTPNPNGVAGTNGNFVTNVGTFVDWFMNLWPDRAVILTSSPPYSSSQGVTDVGTIRCNNVTTYGDHYGEMVVNRQATCPPHAWSQTWQPGPNGSQAIYPTGNPALYKAGLCAFKGPSPLQDFWEAAYGDNTDKFVETYINDVSSVDPNNPSATPGMVQMAYWMRMRWHTELPQPADRANITTR